MKTASLLASRNSLKFCVFGRSSGRRVKLDLSAWSRLWVQRLRRYGLTSDLLSSPRPDVRPWRRLVPNFMLRVKLKWTPPCRS